MPVDAIAAPLIARNVTAGAGRRAFGELALANGARTASDAPMSSGQIDARKRRIRRAVYSNAKART